MTRIHTPEITTVKGKQSHILLLKHFILTSTSRGNAIQTRGTLRQEITE